MQPNNKHQQRKANKHPKHKHAPKQQEAKSPTNTKQQNSKPAMQKYQKVPKSILIQTHKSNIQNQTHRQSQPTSPNQTKPKLQTYKYQNNRKLKLRKSDKTPKHQAPKYKNTRN